MGWLTEFANDLAERSVSALGANGLAFLAQWRAEVAACPASEDWARWSDGCRAEWARTFLWIFGERGIPQGLAADELRWLADVAECEAAL